MKLISHRGNLIGPDPTNENNPDYILNAIQQGYDVEIDVWYTNQKLYLGHDYGKYEIELEFLLNEKLWCHAKNLESLNFMLEYPQINCFWHQTDDFTITSKGFIWTYPNKETTKKSVIVCLDDNISNNLDKNNLYGICGDNVSNW
jgi:hypothetical protein